MSKKEIGEYFGGQALIEGVMMQGSGGMSMAARVPDGRIVTKHTKKKTLKQKYPFLGLPFIRGIFSFAESMYTGFSSLAWSAYQSGEDEEEQITTKDMVFAIAISLVLTICFFVVLPVTVASFSLDYVGNFGRSLIEGLMRIALFVGYVVAIRRIPDMARVFEYHGAEHKTINAWEAGLPITVENVRKQSCLNCRCGTSFVLMSMILMVVIFTFVGNTDVVGRILTKICVMPFVLGLSYEVFRLPLKHPDNFIVKALVAPGLWLQRLTTKEPDDSEIEVAIAALLNVPKFPGAAANFMPPNVIKEDDYKAEQEAAPKAKSEN